MPTSLRPTQTAVSACSNEIRLLLACIQTHPDAATLDSIQQIVTQPIDWNRLLAFAEQHHLLTLLYQRLNTTCAEQVPPELLKQLEQRFQGTLFRSLYLKGELYKVLQILHTHKIEAIPFKGPTLAALVYQNLAQRPFSDLDLLVRDEDYFRVRQVLVDAGYQPAEPLWYFDAAEEEAHLRSRGEYALIRQSDMACVDVHCELVAGSPFPQPFDSLWSFERLKERLTVCTIGGSTIDCLAPTDLLHFLCVHGAKHVWERMAWVCDIAELLHTFPNLDWNGLFTDARLVGSERMVLLGLYLAQHVLNAKLPQPISDRIASDPCIQQLGQQVEQQLLGTVHIPFKGFHWGRLQFHFRLMERSQDQIRYVISRAIHYLVLQPYRCIAPNAQDRAFIGLPGALEWLYYFVRPVRLLRDRWSFSREN